MIRKPMKAPSESMTEEDLRNATYPLACSPKLDGIRGVITEEGVMSNSMKRLGNEFMQEQLNDRTILGLDGELVVGLPYNDPNDPDDDVFNRTSGAIRRTSGEPDFCFYVFDQFLTKDLPYGDRWVYHSALRLLTHPRVKILEQRICHSFEDALAFETELLAIGYEGMMVRSLTAPYKEGRATAKQAYIFKRKPLEQREAKVIGVFEQMENQNEKFTNEMGDHVRSSHQENKVPKDTLGGFILSCDKFGEFNVGTFKGGTNEWRKDIWEQYKRDPDSILGQLVTYTYQAIGSIDKPRQPRAKAEFRGMEDMS